MIDTENVDLVENILDVKSKDSHGRSVIHYCSMAHNIKNIRVLFDKNLQNGIQDYLESTDKYGNTALTLCGIESTSSGVIQISYLNPKIAK